MMKNDQSRRLGKNTGRSESGVTLIETMVAVAILLIVVVGIVPVFTLGFQFTEQQGDTATRTTEYAQDKMEQLLTLSNINVNSDGFNDGTTDTTVFPANPTGCTGTGTNICGLGGTMAANSTVGAIPPAAPVAKFVDYLDRNGNLLTSSTGADYTRQWKITTDATATLKTITIVVTSLRTAGVQGAAPSTTLVCIKSSNL
jgi:type II secretory pathway pseudopilin PulG